MAPQAQEPPLAVRDSISGRVLRKLDTLLGPSDGPSSATGSASPSSRSPLSLRMASLHLPHAESSPLLVRNKSLEDNMPYSPTDVGQSRRSEASSEERFLSELEG